MNRSTWQFTAVIGSSMLLLSGALTAQAGETSTGSKSSSTPAIICPICGHANNPQADYSSKAASTLARGATNALFGWTELIRQPAQEARAGGSVFTGIVQGARRGMQRTVAGAGEMLTFWTPRVNKHYVHFSTDCPICMGRQQ